MKPKFFNWREIIFTAACLVISYGALTIIADMLVARGIPSITADSLATFFLLIIGFAGLVIAYLYVIIFVIIPPPEPQHEENPPGAETHDEPEMPPPFGLPLNMKNLKKLAKAYTMSGLMIMPLYTSRCEGLYVLRKKGKWLFRTVEKGEISDEKVYGSERKACCELLNIMYAWDKSFRDNFAVECAKLNVPDSFVNGILSTYAHSFDLR